MTSLVIGVVRTAWTGTFTGRIVVNFLPLSFIFKQRTMNPITDRLHISNYFQLYINILDPCEDFSAACNFYINRDGCDDSWVTKSCKKSCNKCGNGE